MKVLANNPVRHFVMIYRDSSSGAVQQTLVLHLPRMIEARNGMLAPPAGAAKPANWLLEATIPEAEADKIIAQFLTAATDSASYTPSEIKVIEKSNPRLMARLGILDA